MLKALIVAQICFECIPLHPLPPGTINVTYTMYIPLDHIRMPTALAIATGLGQTNLLRGDDQLSYFIGKINPADGTPAFRIEQRMMIDTASGTVTQNPLSGISRRYDHLTSLVTNKSCTRKDCPGCPTYFTGESMHYPGNCIASVPNSFGPGELSARMDTITAVTELINSTNMSVIFTGAPTLEFIPAALQWLGPIGWANRILIQWHDQVPRYTLFLAHDGFPAHEIRINGTLVYQHEPVLNSPPQTPLSLGPPLDISRTIQGIVP